jgi:hypothetical protein
MLIRSMLIYILSPHNLIIALKSYLQSCLCVFLVLTQEIRSLSLMWISLLSSWISIMMIFCNTLLLHDTKLI